MEREFALAHRSTAQVIHQFLRIKLPPAARLIISSGVPYTFAALGIVYLILVVLAAQFYANPPAGWKPAGWEPRSAVARAATTYGYSVKEAMGTWQFWLLWTNALPQRVRRDHDHQSGFADDRHRRRQHGGTDLHL